MVDLTNPVISIQNVSKRYRIRNDKSGSKQMLAQFGNYLWALKDISLDIHQGEAWGLIGNNGSGKTTLLRTIAGITKPTSGIIKTKGKIASMLSVGVGFNNELTGRENIYLSGAIIGLRKREIDKSFDEIVDFSGIDKYLDAPIKRYSSGMRVRLGFAVAANVNPDILLVDEVLTVGDVAFKKKSLNRLQKIRDNGKTTIVFVTHNMGQILMFCQNVLWLEEGECREMGPSDAVVENYLREIHDTKTEGDETEGIRHEGNQLAKIVDCRVMNMKDVLVENVIHGDKIKISIEYQATGKIERPIFSVIVIGEDNNAYATRFHSGYDLFAVESIAGKGMIEITIPELNLMPGKYRVVPMIESANKELIDKARGFEGFSIIPNTRMEQSGYKFDQSTMVTYVPVKWNHARK